MQVEPFHSVEFLALPVHHTQSGCEFGAGIRLAHTRTGTANRPLCPKCTDLAAAERRALAS